MIPTRIHGMVDYLVAAGLAGAATSGTLGPRARRILGGAAAYHAGYSAATDYEAGLAPIIPMRTHLALDALGGAAILGAGLALRRDAPRDRAVLIGVGVAELLVVALSDARPRSGPGQGSLAQRLAGGTISAPRTRGADWPVRGTDPTYPPLDVPKPVADGVWIVDSGPLPVLGTPLPVRMTVIRLGDGDLVLHSPTRFTPELRAALDRLGRIRHLVAPNPAHWSYLAEWQRACPGAVTWVAPALRRRRAPHAAGVRMEHDLTGTAPQEWRGELEQDVVPGGFGFQEIALFHRPTRTLVLTDLVVNLEPAKLPLLPRAMSWLVGALAPDGKAPAYLRAVILMRREAAAQAASRLLARAPERVIFAHGSWFERDGAAALRRSLSWLEGG